MRKTKFALIVTRNAVGFKYSAGFKKSADAEIFVNEFGGIIEYVDCIFYDDIEDAREHQKQIADENRLVSEVNESLKLLDESALTALMNSSPELVERLKKVIT